MRSSKYEIPNKENLKDAFVSSFEIRISSFEKRRGWDSNPGYVSVHTLSRRAPSTTRSPLRSNKCEARNTKFETGTALSIPLFRVSSFEFRVFRNGEAGIRTQGAGNPAQRFSRPPLSTAQAPLRMLYQRVTRPNHSGASEPSRSAAAGLKIHCPAIRAQRQRANLVNLVRMARPSVTTRHEEVDRPIVDPAARRWPRHEN
jgi:hypothetical protein